MEKSSRRQRERERHVNYVLDVAENLFADHGFIKTSMSNLSEKAEFALGTIYSFFKGKQHLYEQLMDRRMKQLAAFIKESVADKADPRARIEAFIEAKLTFCRNHLSFVRLYFRELHTARPHRLTGPAQKKYAALLDDLAKAFKDGVRDEIFAPADPRALARALDQLTNSFAFSWIEHGSKGSPSTEIEMAQRIFMEGALAR